MKPIKITRELKKYLPKGSDPVKKAMRYSVLSGGKRIRPVLAIEAYRACVVPSLPRDSGKLKDIAAVACAIEFIHAYSLIHDDLPAMDDDDLRRGRPSCHKAFGEANAILAGDALLTLAFNIITRNSNPKTSLEIIKELSDAAGVDGMVGGQALDLEFKDKRRNKKLSEKINLLKTARLFAVSAKAGAITAGSSAKKAKALERFGLYLGLSFQLMDDYLDKESNLSNKAGFLVKKAIRQLEPLGNRSKTLKGLARTMLKRKR